MINIERIIQTQIPDIAPVYGGVRGRTMSSRHQAYAWPAVKETEVDGNEPMPIKVFKERKKVINELSKD